MIIGANRAYYYMSIENSQSAAYQGLTLHFSYDST